jgi:hypothetical protein
VDAEIAVNHPAPRINIVDRFQGAGADGAQMIENFLGRAAHFLSSGNGRRSAVTTGAGKAAPAGSETL